MNWFSGPLDEILGIHTFYILRIAKIIQILSGSYIFVDIIGPARIEQYSTRIQDGLHTIIHSRRLGTTGLELFSYGKNAFLVFLLAFVVAFFSLFSRFGFHIAKRATEKLTNALESVRGQRDDSPYNSVVFTLSVIFALLVVAVRVSVDQTVPMVEAIAYLAFGFLLLAGTLAFGYQMIRFLNSLDKSSSQRIVRYMSNGIRIGAIVFVVLLLVSLVSEFLDF